MNDGLPKAALEQTIFVGPKNNPVAFIKRKEAVDYVNDAFFRQYDLWQKFHLGFGLPLNKTWLEHPKWVIDIIEIINIEYKKINRGG